MQRMGIEALYRRPRTTKPEPGHKIYPYLLRGIEITRPNQVWAMDITYIPMARGFVYLAVVLDWFSRRVLSWRLSITMEAAFCVETLEDALARHGKPDIFNTDQGSQFTGAAFTGVLAANAIAISMDGKGAWRDNVFVERLWRSVKYEEVYLRAYDSVGEARASIGRYLDFYNGRRPHSSLDGTTPNQAYFTRCRSARQPNPGRASTYRRGKSVQTGGTTSWHIKLQSPTGRVERSLGPSDRVQAELLALPMIAEHKAALFAARPRLEAAWAPQYGPGLHIGPDGGRLFATERELHHLDADGG